MIFQKKYLKVATGLLLGFGLFGCSIFGFEIDTVEVSPSPITTEAFPLKRIWSKKMAGEDVVIPLKPSFIYSNLSLATEDKVVYAAGRKGDIKALNSLTGEVLWQINLSKIKGLVRQSAMLAGGISFDESNIYIGSERASLFVINKSTGELVLEKPIKGALVSKPGLIEDKVVVNTANGFLQALDVKTGNEVWNTQLAIPVLTLRGQSDPVPAFGEIVLGNNTGYVSAYFSKDGQLIWQQRISQPTGSNEIDKLNDVIATPIVESKTVYAMGYKGSLASLDLGNGAIEWQKSLSGTKDFTLHEDRIYALDQFDGLYSISKNGGSTVWKQSEFLNRQLTSPAIYKNYVVVADIEGFVYLIDKSSGNIVSKTHVTRAGFATKALVIDDVLVIQARNGAVYAFGQ